MQIYVLCSHITLSCLVVVINAVQDLPLLPSSTYSRSISRYSLSVAARFRSSLGIIIITYVVRLAPRCTLTAKHFDEDEQDVDGVEEIQFKCSHLTEIGSKLSGHDRRATVANQFLGVS